MSYPQPNNCSAIKAMIQTSSVTPWYRVVFRLASHIDRTEKSNMTMIESCIKNAIKPRIGAGKLKDRPRIHPQTRCAHVCLSSICIAAATVLFWMSSQWVLSLGSGPINYVIFALSWADSGMKRVQDIVVLYSNSLTPQNLPWDSAQRVDLKTYVRVVFPL